MAEVRLTETALIKAISCPTPATTLAPGPTLSSSGSKAALRRCCAAHGILIGAIDANKSGQLLYAAQVALGTLNRGSKPRKTAA
jgi:hypothetical protein